MPTKSTTTARRRIPGRSSMATVYQFDRCGARSADAREKCQPRDPEPEPEIDELPPEAIEFGVPDFPDNMTFSGGRRGIR
jgi:hypothetical protein